MTKFRIIISNKLRNLRKTSILPRRYGLSLLFCPFHFAAQVRAITVVLPIHLKNFLCFSFISSTIVLESFPHLHPALVFRQSSVFLRNQTLIRTSCPIAVVLCSSKCYLQTFLDRSHSFFIDANPLVFGFRRRIRRDDAIHEC